MLLIIAALLIAVSIMGKFVSIGHLSTLGWQSSSYPFWLFAIAWGCLYCTFLYYKRLLPRQHPILYLMGLIPIIYGVYVDTMMGGIFINKALLPFKILGLLILGIFSIWLIFWDIVNASTIYFNTGAWHPEIIINGLPSIFIGIVILITVTMLGVRVLK